MSRNQVFDGAELNLAGKDQNLLESFSRFLWNEIEFFYVSLIFWFVAIMNCFEHSCHPLRFKRFFPAITDSLNKSLNE